MKIRKGFVSNSSGSSFVAWGVPLKKIDFSDSLYLKRFDSDFEYYKKVVEENSNCSNWMKEMYKTMLECKTDNEKITYIKNSSEVPYFCSVLIEQGGQESNFIGITLTNLIKNFPDLKIIEIPKFVAKQLNNLFGTNFIESDIKYTQQGWYEG